MGVSTTGVDDFLASALHGTNKSSNEVLRDVLPTVDNRSLKLLNRSGRWILGPNVSFHLVPHMFNHI